MSALEISAHKLRELVDPVIPCAGTDDQIPVLTGVHIWTDEKWILAEATDRFRAAVKRVAAPEGETFPAFDALVPARVLRSILTTFKPSRGNDSVLQLVVEQDKLQVSASAGLLDMAGATTSYFLLAGNFPKVRSLIRAAIVAEPAVLQEGQGFNFDLLASFRVAQLRHEGLRFKVAAPAKPGGAGQAVIIGTDFVGLLMTKRTFDVQDGSDWLDLLGSPEAAQTATEPEPAGASK